MKFDHFRMNSLKIPREFLIIASLRICLVLFAISALFSLLIIQSSIASAADYDVDLHDVMNGEVSGLSVRVNGSGITYHGDAMRAQFENNTGQAIRVRVPIGLRLAPANTSVQTMLTAGGEIFSVAPGSSSFIFKAFCGEEHDSAPDVTDVFHPDGFVGSDMMRTLERITREQTYNLDTQDEIWRQIAGGGDTQGQTGGSPPSKEEAAAAAALLTALILTWALTNGLGPDFRAFVSSLLRIIPGAGGKGSSVPPVDDSGSDEPDSGSGKSGDSGGDDKSKDDDKSGATPPELKTDDKSQDKGAATAQVPAWSLSNRPSPNHRWDPETNKWVPIDELEKRDMTDKGLVFDGQAWVKPPIKIDRLKHKALELESETSAQQRLSNRWSEGEKDIGDYASKPARVVSAVDEYNYQKRRMAVLDKLYDKAKDDMKRISEELRKAQAEGKTGMVEYLRKQHDIAKNNFSRIGGARNNCSERMQVAGDRIMVRGVGASMSLGGKGASDTIGLSKITLTAGRLTNNLLDQARRGNLPGQRQVFKSSGEARVPGRGGTVSDVRTVKLTPGDSLYSSRPTAPLTPATGSTTPDSKLPVLKVDKGDKLFDTVRTYKGKAVIHKTLEGRAVGESSLQKPNQIYIDPSKVQNIARATGARESAVNNLVCHHEHTHIEHKLDYAGMVKNNKVVIKPVLGEPWNENLIKAQDIGNRLQTEMAVIQRMRMDFVAGKIPGVTQQEWNMYEGWHANVFREMKAERDMFLLLAGRHPKPLT